MRLLVGFLCIVTAAGCSDDNKVGKLPDAPPPPDAEVDASTFGPVTLTILQDDEPQVGIKVLFQNADSSVVSETTTGTDGKASASMGPGGFVTAIDPFPNVPQGVQSRALRTFAGVKPGDQLQLVESFGGAQAVEVTIILPVAPNAGEYRISTNCLLDFPIFTGGSGGQPQTTLQMAGCGATTNLLVEARDGNSNLVSSIYKQSVALANNGTIDLTAETYTAATDATFSYTNVPASSGLVNVNPIRATALGRIFYGYLSANVVGGAATLTTKLPVIGNALGVTVSSVNGNSTSHSVADWGAPASTYALDFATALLPDFADAPALDVPNHRITWANNGGAAQPDFVVIEAYLRRETPSQFWDWQIAAPGTTQAVLPVLPATLATLNLLDGDTATIYTRMLKVPGGYDAVRANILSDNSDELVVGLGATGRAQIAEYNLQKGFAAPYVVLRGMMRR